MRKPPVSSTTIAPWHLNLLIVSACLTVVLISVGGILCVTGSIRSCPDWPGCYGKLYPPLALSPILEYIHRVLAALTGLTILGSVIAGLIRTRHLLWTVVLPAVAILLSVLVSIFGALVVIRGLAPGWAAVDLGSALGVVALMTSAAVIATRYRLNPAFRARFIFKRWYAKLTLAVIVLFYLVLVSGVLVAGQNALIGCIGLPVLSPVFYLHSSSLAGYLIRLALALIGVILLAVVLIHSWRDRKKAPTVYSSACLAALFIILEIILQALILVGGFSTLGMVFYTVVMAVSWGLLVILGVNVGLQAGDA